MNVVPVVGMGMVLLIGVIVVVTLSVVLLWKRHRRLAILLPGAVALGLLMLVVTVRRASVPRHQPSATVYEQPIVYETLNGRQIQLGNDGNLADGRKISYGEGERRYVNIPSYTDASGRRVASDTYVEVQPVLVDPLSEPTPWSAGVDEFLLADIYPSAAAAAEAATRQVLEELPADAAGGSDLPELTVYCSEAVAAQRVIAEFRQSGRVGGIALITAMDRPPPQHANGWQANVTTDPEHVSVQLRGGPQPTVATVAYIDKPWVDRFSEYLNRQPQQNHFRAVSDRSYTSELTARNRAIDLAAAQLVGPVRNHVEMSYPHVLRRPGITDAWLQSRIAAHLPSMLADRFVQRFQRPFGNIWQVWVLVDLTPRQKNNMTNLIARDSQSIRAVRTQARRTWAAGVLSLVGIVITILVAYFFLNAATRGYYTWALRIAAVVLALIAAALLS